MRLFRWLTPILGIFLVAGLSQNLSAQGPGYSAAYAQMLSGPQMGPQMSGAGAAPPSYYQPWPEASPYYPDYGHTKNVNGLWEYENALRSHLPWKTRLRIEYMRSKTEQARGLLGNPNAPTYKNQILPVFRNAGGGDLDDLADDFEGVTNGGPGFNLYNPVRGNDIEKPETQGIRMTLDFARPDDTSFEIFGFYAIDDDTKLDARTQIHTSRGANPTIITLFLEDPVNNLTLGPIAGFDDVEMGLQANLLNLRGIPLDDGTIIRLADGTITGGASAVYDLNFRMFLEVEQIGGGMLWKGQPIMRTNNIKVSPVVGVRYFLLQETFRFFGQDSGITYDGQDGTDPVLADVRVHSVPNGFDEDSDGIIDNAGFPEDGMGGGGGGAATGRFIFNNDPAFYPVTSTLNNTIHSHMVGGEVGLAYEMFGSDYGFRVGGRSNFGLLGNFEKINLTGGNIFVTTRQSNLNPITPSDPRPNDFGSSDTHAHISPMFEQQIYMEGPLFQYLPLLRRSRVFRKANFRLGYTFTLITDVARASNSILWQGNPALDIYPAIQTNRSTWRSNSWDFGISWMF
jgi:hypothetical protein